jgi:hypothetical protein
MDLYLFFLAILIVAGALFAAFFYEKRKSAPLQTGTINNEKRDSKESSWLYGETDCFYDCMNAFRWQSKEESDCAEACGLKRGDAT